MNKENLRIVFMGTPDFAVESLRALVDGGYQVVGVVTMPDKPMGRHGSVLQPSPVKKFAVERGLKVLQPVKLKDEEFLKEALPDMEIVAFLPFTRSLRNADREAWCVYDCLDEETLRKYDEILRRITE